MTLSTYMYLTVPLLVKFELKMDLASLIVTLFIVILPLAEIAHGHTCATNGCSPPFGGLSCQSCKSGCYGPDCRSTCHGNCNIDGCDKQLGTCHQCQPGYYGKSCDRRCSRRCMSTIDDFPSCNRYTGQCNEYCDKGYYGFFCDQECPKQCKTGYCNKQTGQCHNGCEWEWSGLYCNKTCSNCMGGKCSSDGHCIRGCMPGTYGGNCNNICPNCYLTGCDRVTGNCDQCLPGYHGHDCDKPCSETCYTGRDGHRHCDRGNGRCSEGCEEGWHGSHCQTKCSHTCNNSQCFGHNGKCISGCEKGYYGEHCSKSCVGCREGDCSVHGKCLHGCKNGWYGHFCNKLCPGFCVTCDIDTGQCTSCSNGYFGEECNKRCPKECRDDICNMTGLCSKGCIYGFSAYNGKCLSSLLKYHLKEGKRVYNTVPSVANCLSFNRFDLICPLLFLCTLTYPVLHPYRMLLEGWLRILL